MFVRAKHMKLFSKYYWQINKLEPISYSLKMKKTYPKQLVFL